MSRNLSERLTEREREVDLLTQALRAMEIANRVGVSTTTTIRNHVQRILAKLEVHNRVEAIAGAMRPLLARNI